MFSCLYFSPGQPIFAVRRLNRMSQFVVDQVCSERDIRMDRQIPSLTVRWGIYVFLFQRFAETARRRRTYSVDTARTRGGPGVSSVMVVPRTICRFWCAPSNCAVLAITCISCGSVRNSPAD